MGRFAIVERGREGVEAVLMVLDDLDDAKGVAAALEARGVRALVIDITPRGLDIAARRVGKPRGPVPPAA